MLRYLGWAFSLAALGIFFPGILLPMFSLNMDMMVDVTGTAFNTALVEQQLSILGTVEKLWQDKRYLVAALIFLFSVVVPLLKSGIIAITAFLKNAARRQQLLNIVTKIGKWSMADVFVVAVFLAVLSTQHADTATTERFSLLGFSIDVKISTETLSAVGEGFYYFVGYCVLSLLGSQLVSAYHNNEAK